MDRINFVIGKNSGLMFKKRKRKEERKKEEKKEKERIEPINSVVYN